MLLWITFACLSAAVTTVLLWTPTQHGQQLDHDPERAVTRDQLTEIDADLARGLIAPEQAAAARTEIARRVLAGSGTRVAGVVKPVAIQTRSSARALIVAATAVPLLSMALYFRIGSPGLPARPLFERLSEAVDRASPADMIAKVEARLRERPDDGQGWAVIAPIYLAQGRAVDAAQAYAKAMKLVGESADRLAGLAKANVLAGNGIVNEPARAAYERLLVIDPGRVEARFWLAIADEQNGRPEVAAATYVDLLAKGAADAPWRKAVEERLAAVTIQKAGPPTPAISPADGGQPMRSPGAPVLASPAAGVTKDQRGNPTPSEFVAAAQKLAPEMREQMIGGRMIPKARDAVTANPKDMAAWSRIVTGFTALGKSDDARSALKEAREAAAGDAPALGELDALATNLGLKS